MMDRPEMKRGKMADLGGMNINGNVEGKLRERRAHVQARSALSELGVAKAVAATHASTMELL